NVISVNFESEDPNKAARIANAIADSYIATTLDSKIKSTKMLSQWLQDRLSELRTQALDADRALQDYKIANNLIATGKGSSPNSEALSTLDTQLSNARLAVAEAKARLDRIQQMGRESIMSFIAADVGSNPDSSRSGRLNWALSNAEILRLRTQYREL